jgi:hypothetical protein
VSLKLAISRTLLTSLTLPTSQSVVQAKVPSSRVFFPNWRLYVLTIFPLLHRKINSPYKGTLSSYGYVLLVIYFLVHVKNPPVLPNLQQMPPMRPISHVRTISSCLPWLFAYTHAQEDTHIGGHNTWYIFCEHVTLRVLLSLTILVGFSTMSSYCDSDGSLQIPIVLANCASLSVIP